VEGAVEERIPMSAPHLDERDIQAVTDALRTGRLALGPKMVEFERAIADYVGVSHAVAVNSGTAALHVIVRALDLGPGDEVLVPSFTFVASVNVLLYERVKPVFVDIEPLTYNLDPADLESKITPRAKGIMAVDIFGHPAEWQEIQRLAERYGLKVIDDSCEALGAEYKGRRLGGFGDAAAFAFYPNKQITTGEGGVVTTNNEKIARLAESMRNQGRGNSGSWLAHDRLGYNYRLPEMSAALGLSQLQRINELLAKRQRVAEWYTAQLKEYSWVRPPISLPHVRASWFVYVVTLAEGIERDQVIAEMGSRGIPARGYFSPIHLQPYVREQFGCKAGELPVTEAIARRTLALPFHSNLTTEEVCCVTETLADVVASMK
jgi:perosamine synthetase